MRSRRADAQVSMPRFPGFRFRHFLGLAFLVVTADSESVEAAGDHVSHIRQLIAEGENGSAMEAIQKHLPTSEHGPELRFLKGIAHEGMGNRKAAMQVYRALIRNHPENPAPYNNLAVLHAHDGNFKAAASVLERALGTDEDYQTIYSNLASIYEKLARDAYLKALDSSEEPASLMLTHIREMKLKATTPPAVPGEQYREMREQAAGELTLPDETLNVPHGFRQKNYRRPGASHQTTM